MKEKIRQYALKNGAQVVGFADAGNFAEAPEGFRPRDIMPKANSVIVIGKALTLGTIQSSNKVVYTAQGETVVQSLDALALQLALYIEELGGVAVPIPTDAPYFHWEAERQYGMGILSHRHAAVKAGLGVLGKNSLLLTPQYGNRITLVSILTDIVLQPDPPLTEILCPPNCHRCLDACPSKALKGNGIVEQKLCRSHVATTSDRGHELTNCWTCRLSCVSGIKK